MPLKRRRPRQGRPDAVSRRSSAASCRSSTSPGVKPGELKLTGRGAGRHLPRQDQEVERPGDRRAQPEASSCPTEPITVVRRVGRFGHDLHLHQLPVEGQPRVEGQGRRRHGGATGRTASAARATKASRPTSSGSRARSATSSTPTRKQNKMTYALLQNAEGNYRRAERRDASRPRPPTPTGRKSGVLRDPHRRAGQGLLADHRRDLHPDAQGAGQAGATRSEVLKFFDWAFKNGEQDGRGARLRAAAGQPGQADPQRVGADVKDAVGQGGLRRHSKPASLHRCSAPPSPAAPAAVSRRPDGPLCCRLRGPCPTCR